MINGKIAIVGGTGAVGQEIVRLFLSRGVSPSQMILFGSKSGSFCFNGLVWNVYALNEKIFEKTKDELYRKNILSQKYHENSLLSATYIIFTAGSSVSEGWIPRIIKKIKNHNRIHKNLSKKTWILDNTSAFRLKRNVPLVIPEINGDLLAGENILISSPNCSTSIAIMALFPLHKLFRLKRFWASTYQAVSGAGRRGISALQSKDYVSQDSPFSHTIAHNLIPKIDKLENSGYTKEEEKMCFESRKILKLPKLMVSSTCVRVPVYRCHSIALNAEFANPVDLKQSYEILSKSPGIQIIDDHENNCYPMPINCTEQSFCGVGRIRIDSALKNGLACWVVGDQLWKGAALNIVQICEKLEELHPIVK